MKEYRGFKYSISARPGGGYLFAVWSADANSRRDEPIWLRTFEKQADAERVAKKWIDGRQPKAGRKRPQPKSRPSRRKARRRTWPR